MKFKAKISVNKKNAKKFICLKFYYFTNFYSIKENLNFKKIIILKKVY